MSGLAWLAADDPVAAWNEAYIASKPPVMGALASFAFWFMPLTNDKVCCLCGGTGHRAHACPWGKQ